jgi:hypothetical protein
MNILIEKNSALWFLLLVIGLSVTFIIETVAVLIRIIGVIIDAPFLTNHVALILLLLSRVSTSVALIMSGLLVDLTGGADYYVIAYIVFSSIVIGVLTAIYKFPIALFNILTFLLKKIHKENFKNPTEMYEIINNKSRVKINGFNALSSCLLILGFSVPGVLAINYPEYRATLLQTGFLFNAIATILNTTKIEKSIAKVMHDGNKYKLMNEVYEYLKSKIFGFFLAFIILVMYYILVLYK